MDKEIKKCLVCDKDIEEGKEVERSGEFFCSEEHAEEHSHKSTEGESKNEGHSCCN